MNNKQRVTFLFTSLSVILMTAIFSLVHVDYVLAQDPSTWQQSATGLSVTQNEEAKTAGLGFVVQAQNWPTLSLQGGVQGGGYHQIKGPVGIELGAIKVSSGGAINLASESTDWATNKLSFNVDGNNQLKLWVSRITPALLVQSSAESLQFLSGDIPRTSFDGERVNALADGPVFPKYVAYQSGGNIYVQPLTTSKLVLPNLEGNWLLLWYGDHSHFVETKKPLSYRSYKPDTVSLPAKEAYQADAPILFVFENQPTSIKYAGSGGVDISFASAAGYVSLLPLYGRDHLPVVETETWSQGLPAPTVLHTQWWAEHLCAYPEEVTESYSYNPDIDQTTIQEQFSFLTVCPGGTNFAPIPPMLALAQAPLNVTFSGSVVNGNLSTEFGPSLGVENASTYSWSISGLKRYSDGTRFFGNAKSVPAELEAELEQQVSQIISSGHFAPWVFTDSLPRYDIRGDIYWLNPADVIYHLVEIADVLPSTLKAGLIEYIRTEQQAYPSESVYNLPLDEGTVRGNFSVYGDKTFKRWQDKRSDVFLQDVPLYNLYALSRYYKLTGDVMPANVWQNALQILGRDMQEQDWATFYWFDGYQERRVAVINANRYFAGLIGFVNLAELAGDQHTESLGRALLAKAAVLRVGMAKYPRYLYSNNLIELPANPSWQPEYTEGVWMGHLYNYNWTGAYDDARQIIILSQFNVMLFDQSGFMRQKGKQELNEGPFSPSLIAYRDLVPETARFLVDYVKSDVEIYANKVEALNPHWYAAFAEGMLGGEHNLSHPIDSFQIFMAKALIQQEPADQLAHYIDIPWLQAGDLFYIHKLAETIKAYRGVSWDDSP